jgi:hypothetical protein
MGFHEQDFYHATNRDFAQFDPKFSDPGEDMGAAFFTSSPTVADEYLPGMFVKKGGGEGADRGGGVVRHYTEGSQIMPARIRNPEDFMIWDMRGNAFDIDFVKSQIGEAKKKGLPGVIFTEMPDPGMMSLGRPSSSHIVAVLDPSRIRSPHAMFDPAKRNSANILAGAGAAGLVGAGMAAQDRDPQNGMWF